MSMYMQNNSELVEITSGGGGTATNDLRIVNAYTAQITNAGCCFVYENEKYYILSRVFPWYNSNFDSFDSLYFSKADFPDLNTSVEASVFGESGRQQGRYSENIRDANYFRYYHTVQVLGENPVWAIFPKVGTEPY